MNLFEEFRLYENMWDTQLSQTEAKRFTTESEAFFKRYLVRKFFFDLGEPEVAKLLYNYDIRFSDAIKMPEINNDTAIITLSKDFAEDFEISDGRGYEDFIQSIIYNFKDNNKNMVGKADTDLTEAADPNGMAYWAAEHLGDLYTMIDTKTPKAGTPAYNKKCRDANKRVKERWNIANDDESMDIIFKGYSFWKHYKIYENLWESVETSAIVFVGNERNKETLLSKVAKTKPAYTTTVYSIDDFLRKCDIANREAVRAVKFYTDTEGMTELEKACVRMPERMKKGILDKTTLIEEALIESRSIADLEAEIAKLQQELTQAKIAEKKASYGGNLPKTVWTWDIYLEPADKGTWTGIENDLVFETKDKALDAAWELLNELDDGGKLDGDPDDYYIEAFEIPLSSVSASILKFNKLVHLI